MSDKAEVSHFEQAPAPPRKRTKCLNHFKKFWWLYLIGLICIIVLVVPLVILVGIPNLAQDKLNDAKFELDQMVLTRTRAKSFHVAINATMRASVGSFKARLDPFTAEMYLEDLQPHETFLNVDLPKIKAKSRSTVNVTQDVAIQNEKALTTFATWLLNRKSLRVTMKGRTKFHVNGVSKHFGVSIKKTMDLVGVDRFAGLEVTQTSISAQSDAKGDNLHGFVTIPNRSILRAEFGNVSFNTLVYGNAVGIAFMDNLVLEPGSNNVSMRANLSQEALLGGVTQKPICETGILPLQLEVRSVINAGESLAYFEDAFKATNLTTELDIREMLKRDLNLTVACTDG